MSIELPSFIADLLTATAFPTTLISRPPERRVEESVAQAEPAAAAHCSAVTAAAAAQASAASSAPAAAAAPAALALSSEAEAARRRRHGRGNRGRRHELRSRSWPDLYQRSRSKRPTCRSVRATAASAEPAAAACSAAAAAWRRRLGSLTGNAGDGGKGGGNLPGINITLFGGRGGDGGDATGGNALRRTTSPESIFPGSPSVMPLRRRRRRRQRHHYRRRWRQRRHEVLLQPVRPVGYREHRRISTSATSAASRT